MSPAKSLVPIVILAFAALTVPPGWCGADLMKDAQAAFDAGDHAKALELFGGFAKAEPDSPSAPDALLMAGVCNDWLGAKHKDPAFFDKGRDYLERLIREYPKSSRTADAHLYLGEVYSGHTLGIPPKRVDCGEAIKHYELAIASADRDWIKAQAKGRIGQCLESLGRKDEARAAYKEVRAKYPGTPWAKEVESIMTPTRGLFDEAEALFRAKKHQEALALYLRVAREDPRGSQAPDALLMAGVCYDWLASKRGDPKLLDKEIVTLKRLIKDYPASSRTADAHLYIGQVLSGHTAGAKQRRVDYPAAIKHYELAIASADRDWIKAQARGRIGQCLASMDRKEEALAAYREVKEKYPDTPWAKEVESLLK